MIQLLDELDILISVDENLSLLQEFVINAAANGKFGIADKTFRENFKSEELNPMNWEIVKIEEIAEFTNGYAFKSSDYKDDGIGIIRMSDLKYGEISVQHLKYVSKSFLSELSSALQVKPNDLVIGMSGSIGRPCFNRTKETFLLNQRVGKLTPHLGLVLPEYLAISLASLEKYFLQISMGSAIKNLSTAQIKQTKILLPPLAIQKEIVTHYKKFSSLTKALSASLSSNKKAALKFRNSSIDAISTAQTPEELKNSWERIQGNWEIIAESSESIADLRGLILTFAASGLLIKQNLNETPPPFESVSSAKVIPKNWIWCELKAIANYGGNGSASPKSIPKDGWILDLEDIEKSTSRLLVRSFGADRETTSNKSSFNAGDVLYGKLRPYLDKVLVADMPGFCTTEIVPIRPKDGLDPNWLRICLKRPEFIKKVTELSYGTKMPRLGTNDAKISVHPIPPLEEQRRIVEAVEQLFQICDQLEQDLILVKSLGDKFARSVVSAQI